MIPASISEFESILFNNETTAHGHVSCAFVCKRDMKERIRYYIIYIILTAAGILLDQYTKMWAVDALRGHEAIPVIPGILELTYVENRGAAFGMMQGRQGFFLILTVIVSLGIVYMLIKVPVKRHMFPLITCLVAVLSGAIGNLIDRTAHGYVVDFIYFKPVDFPVFNVADIFVTCGMIMLMLLLLFYYKDADLEWARKKNDPDKGQL
jgi:signal peptidase II